MSPNDNDRREPSPDRAACASGQVAADSQVTQFVSTIKTTSQQIGEHMLQVLQHPNTVAVLTTVVVGPTGQQHLVSIALGPEKTSQIQALLRQAEQTCEQEEPCMGFHCFVRPRPDGDSGSATPTDPADNESAG